MMRNTFRRLAAATADQQRPQLLIAYGSQTGTAETYARMLGPMAVKHNFTPVICTLNDAVTRLGSNSAMEPPKAMLMVCSTYGTGEFPSNAQRFADALESGQLTKLKGVDFSILGLGNSRNDAFNAAAKTLDKGMRAAGAKPVVRMQLSCEVTQGHDTSYRTWKRAIWKSIGEQGVDTKAPLTYSTPQVFGGEAPADANPGLPPGYARAHVNRNEKLSPAGYEPEAGHLTFTVPVLEQVRRLGGRTATFMDNVLVMPRNAPEYVERAVARLGLKDTRHMLVAITPLPGAAPSHIDHRKMRLDDVLSTVIDLSAIPTRSFLESLATTATSDGDRNQLEDLANDLSSNSVYDKLVHEVFTVADALEMFPSCDVSVDFLLTHAPHIQPRQYSIARDNADWKNDEFEVVYSVPTRHGADGVKTHRGLATTMLSQLKTGDEVFVKFETSPTRTIPNAAEPLAIIALGSGIGAARAMLQRRRIAKRSGANVGPCIVYIGHRHAGKDDYFKDELKQMQEDGVCEVRRIASHDSDKFQTPLDLMDASLSDFLGARGEVFYCGLGGSVPHLVESTLRRCKVDVGALRASGRYHEEYFTLDVDTENLLRSQVVNAEADTLAGRFGECNMFCMQCEQTHQGRGCHTTGVCGKTPRVAAMQDYVIHQTKILGFYADALRRAGQPDDVAANRLTLFALFSTLTNVNFDEARFVKISKQVREATNRLRAAFTAKGLPVPALPRGVATICDSDADCCADQLVSCGRQVGVLTRFTDPKTQSAACVAELLTYGLKGLAAYTDHSLMNGKEDPAIYEYMHRALGWLADPERWGNLEEGLGLALECGKVNVASMGLLYNSNATLGVPSPHVVPVKPKPGKCILVSGHDLIMVESLLKQCAPLGIQVYTHGELLPAHSYEKLRAYGNLAGHYGGAWMRQSLEFPHFPGPVMMTTNCLTEPHDSYAAKIFTAGAVGWSGVPHLGDNMETLNLAPLIECALKCPGFTEADTEFAYPDPVGQKRPATHTVGFGHETVLGAAPTIIEEIKKGNITRFFLVGGCDGFEGQRSYYTDLVKNMPATGVVLTLGCGKFRVLHLADKVGTIGDTGIPRILDMGQCNDSFAAVQVALALAQALDCKVSDLPLSIVLSWFEQKAVAVLLSCLHLGLSPLHIGPTLPAFVTPEVLQVLVDKFGVRPIGDPVKDVVGMSAASGAS